QFLPLQYNDFLLLCGDRKLAIQLAQRLEDKNILRRQLEQKAFFDACKQVENHYTEEAGIVVYSSEWHIGILGIVAARCAERFHRPVIVLGKIGEVAVGSGRSSGGYDLHSALGDCQELLLTYGGHKQAAGVKLLPQNIPAFREGFQSAVAANSDEDSATPKLKIDLEVELTTLNEKNFAIIQQMAPFGPHNMRPVFSTRCVRVVGTPRKIKNSHVAFQVRQGERTWSAIAFQMAHKFPVINSGQLLDIAFVIRKVKVYGKEYLELEIRDVRRSELC
ncbi:MAG: DHHA1 domain-containing protein, partial [Bacteroidota bacterium]